MSQKLGQCWRHLRHSLGTGPVRECNIPAAINFFFSAIFHSVSPCLRVRQFFFYRDTGNGLRHAGNRAAIYPTESEFPRFWDRFM